MDSMFVSMSSSISSSRSDSIKRASSLRSHQLSRNFAKVAVDSVNFAQSVRTGMPKADVQKGDYHILKADYVGEKDYDRLCKDKELALVQIHYCQRGLEHLGEELDPKKLKEDSGKSDLSDAVVDEIKQMKARDVINHDYLVLELQRGDPNREAFYILAEKLAAGSRHGQAGIFITFKPAEHTENFLLNKNTKLYVVNCEKKHVPLETLLRVLKKEDPDYSLRNANCWDYATATTKTLIMTCADVAGVSAEEKARLQKEHDNLEANLNSHNMKNIAKAVKDWASRAFSAVSG